MGRLKRVMKESDNKRKEELKTHWPNVNASVICKVDSSWKIESFSQMHVYVSL